MAFSLLALLHPALVEYAQRHPLWADLSGGLKEVKDLQAQVEKIREGIFKISAVKSAVAADARLDKPQNPKVHVHAQPQADKQLIIYYQTTTTEPSVHTKKANFNLGFPELPLTEKLETLKHMRGSLDLEKTIVVVGMGEVGPWGNSRTRYQLQFVFCLLCLIL